MEILQKIKNGLYKYSGAKGTSDIWQYYNKIEVTETGEYVPFVTCAKCDKVFKFGKSASTSNLKKHSCYKRIIAKMGIKTPLKRELGNSGERLPEEDSDSLLEPSNTNQQLCEEDSNKSISTSKIEQNVNEKGESMPLKQEFVDANGTARNEESISKEILQKIDNGEYKISSSSGSSDVWKYFHKIECTRTGEIVPFVICTDCDMIFKFCKGYSSSNLKKHSCHKHHFKGESAAITSKKKLVDAEELCGEEDIYSKRELIVMDDPLWETDNCAPPMKRMRFNINHQLRADILNSCIKFTYHDLRSMEVINGNGFKDLARCLVEVGAQIDADQFSIDDILPQTTTISHSLKQMHHENRENFLTEIRPLMETNMCSSTVDIWADIKRQRNFITFTVHFIDHHWQLQSRILFTTEFDYCADKDNAKQSRRNIINAIECKCDELKLDRNLLKNITFTTDPDSNIKKALQQNFSTNNCLSYILNSILERAFDKEILTYSAPDVQDLIRKCESLVSQQKQIGSYEKFESAVQQEGTASWSTKFEMLWFFGKNGKFFENICKKSDETSSMHEFDALLLEKLTNMLEPFRNVLTVVENKNTPTIHLVLLHKHILKAKLSKLQKQETNSEIQTILSNCLDQIIDAKFRPDKIHKIAAFLWPQYKQMRYLSEAERDEVYELVKAELLEISNAEISLNSETDDSQNNCVPDDLLTKYKDINMQVANNNVESQICFQIEMYKNACFVENDVLNWWRSHSVGFPLLGKLARKILCIPASSAASANCSSLKQPVLEQRRTNLIGENVDAILFLHSQPKNQIQANV